MAKLVPGGIPRLARLSDAELLANTRRLLGRPNHLLADLLEHLAEVEARGIHRARRCARPATWTGAAPARRGTCRSQRSSRGTATAQQILPRGGAARSVSSRRGALHFRRRARPALLRNALPRVSSLAAVRPERRAPGFEFDLTLRGARWARCRTRFRARAHGAATRLDPTRGPRRADAVHQGPPELAERRPT
jgi:hypothetical protein